MTSLLLRYLHHDEDSTDDDAWDAAAQNSVGDNREGLIHDHVTQEQRYEEKVAVLSNGLDLLGICALFTANGGSELMERYRVRGRYKRTGCRLY